MSVGLYMDVQVEGAITRGLRRQHVDILTAQEDGTAEWRDAALLGRASSLGRVLFTRDKDFLTEAHRLQASGVYFAGVVYAHQMRVKHGVAIRNLAVLSLAGQPQDFASTVLYLPL